MKTAVILLAVACFYVRNAACDVTDDDEHREWLLEEVKHDPRLYELFQSLTLRELTQIHDSPRSQARGYPFRCVVNVSDTVPTSVHKLRPSDINAIAAMGDSLSRGLTGRWQPTLAGRRTNYRGIGMEHIFKAFNPDLKGYSITISDRRHYKTHLNVAVGGKTSQ
ncbi:PREDICTED: phospholipase B1, membrane-associated-like [Priapulus caudatus]|uniref:Phospholipase B1, membrane-associated-like n=1 Tax=Priapulus caudatus TaxID=37621 RepID=A0ABM1F311_PRICU|nr:PREDICTED: phospholipase B1, membrane-associated-like [Priapulus caudatus]